MQLLVDEVFSMKTPITQQIFCLDIAFACFNRVLIVGFNILYPD
tara:strand:+ start:134839 stop:134970 length:132 start_codon:yes stop_codon:yes gene_type:complete